MPVRGLQFTVFESGAKIPKTVGEWYQLCFYKNLDDALRAGRAMTYGSIGGKPISVAEGYRIVARAGRRMASALHWQNAALIYNLHDTALNVDQQLRWP
jgi:hypothetical protein